MRLRDPPEITAHARHLLVTQPTPECGARCVRACVRARHLTNTVALCTFELPYIVWSGAFISTLVNVSAGKVSSFDALTPPPPLWSLTSVTLLLWLKPFLCPARDFLCKQAFQQGIWIIWWASHQGDYTELIPESSSVRSGLRSCSPAAAPPCGDISKQHPYASILKKQMRQTLLKSIFLLCNF